MRQQLVAMARELEAKRGVAGTYPLDVDYMRRAEAALDQARALLMGCEDQDA
jgi:hypothetical protein